MAYPQRPVRSNAAAPSNAVPVIAKDDRNAAIFQMLKRKYANEPGVIITPGFLRIEQKIINGKQRYTFAVVKDTNSDSITEVKLDRNDRFVASHLGLFLMKRDSTVPGIEVLQTYPNDTEIPTDTVNFICKHLEAFYNGSIGVQVGQTVLIEKMDTRRFRHIEQNIQSATITKSSATEYTGFSELTPNIELQGEGKTLISLDAPVDAAAKVGNTIANMSNYLVMMFRGYLVTIR